jgi:cell division protease FtsH
MTVGFELCSLRIGQQTVPLVQVVLPYLPNSDTPDDFWVVQQRDLPIVSRYVRRLTRSALRTVPPVMVEDERRRLWQNTVGFLRSPREPFRRFRIAKKRGVLLLGAPGNGKTMACRWLSGECSKAGLKWRSVTSQEYRSARQDNSLGELFHLDRPGVVLFDDFDLGIRDRDQVSPNEDHSTFLSELDGMASRGGVVFLFTSNARLSQLDPAFRRPGRIDVIMEFRAPDFALRRRYLSECWQTEIAAQLDLDEIATVTDGLNFAELEELRKLLVLDYLETDEWNWPRAWQAFNTGRGPNNTRKIGFSKTPAEAATLLAPTRELLEAARGE